jgi:hypothetical protein
MRKISLIIILGLFPFSYPYAENLEDLRNSSENLTINIESFRQNSQLNFEIIPGPVYDEISRETDIKIHENGDIEIINPYLNPPRVEELPDDKIQEQYDNISSINDFFQNSSVTKSASSPEINYNNLDRNDIVPQDLKNKALDYFSKNSSRITNKRYLGIVDFSKHSSKARFFIINMQTGDVLALHVAHGKGSDPDHDGYANIFSNQPNSNASSLGFYLTKDIYNGKHGRSMRLYGLSPTNSNALSRAIVIHEATYVREDNVKQGRSFGCLAVSSTVIDKVISMMKGQALIYAGISKSP